MRIPMRAGLLLVLVMLGGCKTLFGQDGYFRDREDEYLDAYAGSDLQLPEGLEAPAVDDLMVIPPINRSTRPAEFEVPRPEPLGAQAREKVSLRHVDDRAWLVVDARPAAVWPALKEFWDVNGIPIEYEDAKQGVMETVWLTGRGANATDLFRQLFSQFSADPDLDTRDKFRLRLEHGVRQGTTEVHLTHKSILAAEGGLTTADALRWPQKSDNSGLENGMLLELQVHLARGTQRARTVSLLAQSLVGKPKAVYTHDAQRNPELRLELDFNRAWASVGHALEEARIAVKDLNRTDAIYYVLYGDEPEVGDEEGKSFFSKLIPGGGSDQEIKEAPLSTGGAWQLRLRATSDSSVRVTVHGPDGSAAPVEISEPLLTKVKEYLS